MTAKRSLADFNTRRAGETPFKFEFKLPDGTGSGLILHVYGDSSPQVTKVRNELVNEARQREAAREALARPGEVPTVDSFESILANNERLAASRIAGWEGLEEPFSPEGALELVRNSPEITAQVVAQSTKVGNFLKL